MLEQMKDEDFQKYDEDMKVIANRYPKALFEIVINPAELDEPLTHEPKIKLIVDTGCGCIDRRGPKLWKVKASDDSIGVTLNDCINHMISRGWHTDCSHRFFEGIDKKFQGFTTFFGS